MPALLRRRWGAYTVAVAFCVALASCFLVAFAAGAAGATSPAFYPSSQLPASGPPAFGHAMLEYFQLDPNYTNLNHGSYGAPPKSVTAAALAWEERVELNPDKWFRFEYYDAMDALRARVAAYIGARKEDVVFVPNASHGMNAVLRSLKLKAGEKILYLNTAYRMVVNTLEFLHNFDGDQLVMANVTWPGSSEQVLDAVRAQLELHGDSIKVATFSQIISLPAAVLPVKELVDLCHEYGVLVIIDGAHALGQIPLDVDALGADFWVGNGHKWLYSPKGSAVLWVRGDRQHLVEPTVISWEGVGVPNTHYQLAFAYTGTASYSPYLAMSAALDFREWAGGEDKVLGYIHGLAVNASRHMAERFGTDVLVPEDRFAGMFDVRIPTTNSSVASTLPATLLERFNTWVPVYPILPLGGTGDGWYIRVSCQIYNEMADFDYLADSVWAIVNASVPAAVALPEAVAVA